MNIEVMPDVNFWLDACRYRDTLAAAVSNRTDRMKTLSVVERIGTRSGVRLHTGDHVLRNIRKALATKDVSHRSVTREAWTLEDIEDFIAFVVNTVEATGGRSDVATISHDAAIGQARFSGAPDGEDHQVLVMAINAAATVLATNDTALLGMGTFAGVEIWKSTEVDGEVFANVKRLQKAAMQ
jgi:hypothetical protein